MTDAMHTDVPAAPLRVELGARSYEIRFYNDDAIRMARAIKPFCAERSLIVTNETIWSLHGAGLEEAFREAGIDYLVARIGDGEAYKSLESASRLYDNMIRNGFGRKSTVIAFGGGVVGDLAGYVAATFMRGVSFIQIPTTVVAMVDSSVGGKTGVDHPLGKNLIGAFHQPKLVAVDIAYLRTLDQHNLHGGFAEVIKYGVILDSEFFSYLEEHIEGAISLDPGLLLHCVRTSCAIKARIVEEDELESGVRAYLNYGHTFAHAIESVGEYKEKQFHGQAVAIGMNAAAEMACDMGLFSRDSVERQLRLIKRAGLPFQVPDGLSAEDIADRMKTDKKVLGGKVRFVLPREIGKVEVREDVSRDAVLAVLRKLSAPIG